MNKTRWTNLEVEFLKENAGLFTDLRLSQIMSKEFERSISKDALRKQRQRLAISKAGHRGYFKLVEKV